jgi:IS4 transposase
MAIPDFYSYAIGELYNYENLEFCDRYEKRREDVVEKRKKFEYNFAVRSEKQISTREIAADLSRKRPVLFIDSEDGSWALVHESLLVKLDFLDWKDKFEGYFHEGELIQSNFRFYCGFLLVDKSILIEFLKKVKRSTWPGSEKIKVKVTAPKI